MQDENKPKVNWGKETVSTGPEDINLDDLPKVYPQFAEDSTDKQTNKNGTPVDPQGETKYVEFDENQYMGRGEFIDDEPFDVIELPSKGYFYKNKKSTVRVGYLTAADENILTSPNLIQQNKAIDVLLRRKIKDRDINVTELLPGDRTAIMIFLRATGYGTEYPIMLTDPITGNEFEHVVMLDELPIKEISEKPDDNCEFPFHLPKGNVNVKFRLLSPQDERQIKEIMDKRAEIYKDDISIALTSRLERSIMEIDGNRDKEYI